MHIYIKQGRFGEFVEKVFETKRKEEQEKWENDENWKLWLMYTRILPDKSFMDWKTSLSGTAPKQTKGSDADLTTEDIQNIIDDLFPE